MNFVDLVNEVANEMRRETVYQRCSTELFERELVRRICFETGPGVPFVPGIKKPEINYLRAERFSKEHGIPVPMTFIKVEATNPDGSAGEVYEERSRTFNRNLWNSLYGGTVSQHAGAVTFGAGFMGMKDTTGAVAAKNQGNAVSTGAACFVWTETVATLGTSTKGIVVGTGTAAESFEGYALSARVAEGTGAGQMNYQATPATVLAYNSGTKVWTATISRILNNNSGGTIVIAEAGIYGVDYTGSIYMFCRDLLGATVSVLNAGQLTVTYTMTLTFPA